MISPAPARLQTEMVTCWAFLYFAVASSWAVAPSELLLVALGFSISFGIFVDPLPFLKAWDAYS